MLWFINAKIYFYKASNRDIFRSVESFSFQSHILNLVLSFNSLVVFHKSLHHIFNIFKIYFLCVRLLRYKYDNKYWVTDLSPGGGICQVTDLCWMLRSDLCWDGEQGLLKRFQGGEYEWVYQLIWEEVSGPIDLGLEVFWDCSCHLLLPSEETEYGFRMILLITSMG